MKCHKCGGTHVEDQITDLPFRLDMHKVLVVKDTPAQICEGCGEIMLSDVVMKQVDELIDAVRGVDAELEVVRYAA